MKRDCYLVRVRNTSSGGIVVYKKRLNKFPGSPCCCFCGWLEKFMPYVAIIVLGIIAGYFFKSERKTMRTMSIQSDISGTNCVLRIENVSWKNND